MAVTEWPDGFLLDPHAVKMLSGSDIISIRKPDKGSVEINTTWSVVVACNALPRFEPATTLNIWRHVVVLPIQSGARGRDCEWDRRLTSSAARMAILAWLVAGYSARIARPSNGPIDLPSTVKLATADYRVRHDP